MAVRSGAFPSLPAYMITCPPCRDEVCHREQDPELEVPRAALGVSSAIVGRTESAFGADFATPWPWLPLTLRDGKGSSPVVAVGPIIRVDN